MATFKYKAISNAGDNAVGVIAAYDEFEAIDKIKQAGNRIVVSLTEVEERNGIKVEDWFKAKKVNTKKLALMCSQFSIILKAGLPVVRTVELIAEQTTDKELKAILKAVAEDVSNGHSLSASFENKSKGMPTTFIETVRSGEDSGTLDVAFSKLHIYFDKSTKVNAKVRSAMVYPMFLLGLATIVIAVIMTFTMPVFEDMFASMNTELPLLTQVLIDITNFMLNYWYVLFGAIALIIIGLRIYANTENGRVNFAKMQLKLPMLGDVAKMRAASQFANTMTTLLSAGLTMVRSIGTTARVLDNYHLGLRLGTTVVGLEEGRRLGDCLKEIDIFPHLLVEMAAVGEETGSLENTLDTISAYYDNEVEIATARALGALQPAITVIMGAVIGIIVIALYLPMFTMYGGI